MLTQWDDLTFSYNANGIRTRKGDTYYELDGSNIISETKNGKTIRYYYGTNGITAFRYNGEYYYYEKNLQGDITGIYDGYGNNVAEYAYDAWGNCTILADFVGISAVNPFRYRGYYYDSETGLYYLNSRYYDPQVGRFVNADDISYLGVDKSLTRYNMFIYCNNNHVIGYDPTGHWDWGKFWDKAITVLSGAVAVVQGTVTTVFTLDIKKGISSAIATFGTINNAVNAIYYEFSDGKSNISTDTYRDGYVSRWERLDYTKQQTGDKHYNMNAWRYYSEYSLHMYGWFATGWAFEKNIPILSDFADSFADAHVKSDKWDGRPHVDIATVVVGILGM